MSAGPSTLSPSPRAIRRVGLMGGSFDPIHSGHLALAEVALRHLSLDEVRWIPVGQAWQKSRRLADGAHRRAMVELATADEPRFVVDTIELDRNGPSYTWETVRTLQAREHDKRHETHGQAGTEWFLIIGQDQYANFPTWHGWQDLLQAVTLAVARRGHDRPAAPSAMQGLVYRMVELPLPPLPVSSTDIRARLSRGEDPMTLAPELVPASVARYIATHQLYAPLGAPR